MQQNNQTPIALPINRKLLNSHLIKEKIGSELYQSLFVHLLQVPSSSRAWLLSFLFDIITQICDNFEACCNVRFLSRYVLDLVLDSSAISDSEISKSSLASFIHTLEIFNPEIINSEDGEYHGLYLVIQEHNLQNVLEQVRAKIKDSQEETDTLTSYSPYDYTKTAITSTTFGSSNLALIKKGINSVIDLALSHSDLSSFSAEEIFSGSCQAFMEVKIPSLIDEVLPSITGFELSEKSQQIKCFILQNINE